MSGQGKVDHGRYLSPFSWRYGSKEMRTLWSEAHKRLLWRRIWVALAEAQQSVGLVSEEQVADLRAHQQDLDLERAAEIEAEIHHDVMSEVRTYAEQCPTGGGIIHLGATSMDVVDNGDALRIRQALDLVLQRLDRLLEVLAGRIERHADLPVMGFTHLQPAEPTTMGYRLSQYAQDLWMDRRALRRARDESRGKGLRGAVGTSASYAVLLEGTGVSAAEFERRVLSALDLQALPVSTQTYARKQDYIVLCALAGVGQSLHKLAFDLRVLQSPPLGEWAEPFGAMQVGSSAMPFKRNPIVAENICSLARLLAVMPRTAWDNAANSLLERTLDDSANRRTVLPEAFLITDELLRKGFSLMDGLQVSEEAAARLMEAYGTFAASERLLMAAVKRGGDRQELHEVIREHSLASWEEVKQGRPNPLADHLCADPRVTGLVPSEQARALLDAAGHVGDAPERARALARTIKQEIAHSSPQGD